MGVLDLEFGEPFEKVGGFAGKGGVEAGVASVDYVETGTGGRSGVPAIADVNGSDPCTIENRDALAGVFGGKIGQKRRGTVDTNGDSIRRFAFESSRGLDLDLFGVVVDLDDFAGGDGLAVNVHLAQRKLHVDDGQRRKGQKTEKEKRKRASIHRTDDSAKKRIKKDFRFSIFDF